MVDEPVLDLVRVMQLVADAVEVERRGLDFRQGAREIVARHRPSVREVKAARRENQDVHGGGTPEPLHRFVNPNPIPDEIARLRRVIDDVLVEVEQVVSEPHGGRSTSV